MAPVAPKGAAASPGSGAGSPTLANYLTALGLSFCTCEMGVITVLTSQTGPVTKCVGPLVQIPMK